MATLPSSSASVTKLGLARFAWRYVGYFKRLGRFEEGAKTRKNRDGLGNILVSGYGWRNRNI